MQHSKAVHSRNMFIILFFLLCVIVHLIFVPFLGEFYEMISALFGILSALTLLVLHRRGVSPTVLRLFIIIGYNAYLFLVNLLLPDLAKLLFLMFPLILTAFYNVVWLNVLITVITGLELVVLLYLFGPIYLMGHETKSLIQVAFIFIMVAVLGLLYTIKIGPQWNNVFTENKKMGTLLTSKRGYLNLFFEHAEDAIVVFDLNQNIVAVNPAFEKMYGWQREESIGRSLRLSPPSEATKVAERIQNVLAGKSYHFLRTREMRKDGSIFDAELTIAPIYDTEKKVIATSFIARDITPKLQAERLKIDAEKLKAIGEISASVAHEVRNPMTSISGFVQMMKNDPANPYRVYTEIMYNEINRINLIISEFLVLSKQNLKKTTEFHIENSIEDIVTMFEPEFSNRSIFCDVQLSQQTALISGHEDGMKQILINLLKNACEAIVKNGKIIIKVTYKKETVVISIFDNGPGMDDETIDNLFEPFYTTKPDGTGLGMMITKKIIVDYAGTITVDSIKNEGTKIEITLPLLTENKTAIING